MQVVLAAQKAFLYGQEGTTSTAFFTRLLSPIIAQLPAELPEKMAKREIGSSGLNAEYAMGTAVVSALVQMGIRSGGETMLKPLHHQVIVFVSACGRELCKGNITCTQGHSLPALVDRL